MRKHAMAIWPLSILMLLVIAAGGCATAQTGKPSNGATPGSAIVDPPARPGLPSLLVVMPESSDFIDVRRGLVSEVQKNFNLSTLVLAPNTSVEQLAAAVDRVAPVCAVLMNNGTLDLYRRLRDARKGTSVPPAVVVMASFLEEMRTKLRGVTGIAYEVPGLTAFVNLRSIIKSPVRRVGIVYRAPFRRFIARQTELAAREHIEVVGVEVSHAAPAEELRAALHTLATKNHVDAFWMLNDNDLIRDAAFLDEAWRTQLRSARRPLIVGVPNLVDPSSPLGTLAVVPDHEALGLQAANLIFDLAESGWRVENHPIDLPLSVKTVVDMKQAREFGLRQDAAARIDRALE